MGVGKKIRFLRRKQKLTQAELAKGIISTPYLSLIENEKAVPPIEIIRSFSDRLHVNEQEILNTEQREIQILDIYRKKAKELHQYLLQNDIDQAEKICEKLLNDKNKNRYSSKIDIHINLSLAKLNISKGNANQVKKLIKEIKQTYQAIEHDPELSFELNYVQGSYSFMRNNYIEALNHFTKATKYLDKADDIRKGYVFYNISLINSILSYSAKSIYYGEKSLGIFSKNPHLVPTLKVLLTMGINYRKIGEDEEAKNNFEKVLSLTIGSDNFQIYRAQALHNIGRCELNKNVDTSLDYFIEALQIKQKIKFQNHTDLAITLEEIANCYFLRGGPFPLALQYLAKVKELLINNKDTIQYGNCKMLEGQIHKETKNIILAIECFSYALKVFENTQDSKNIANAAEHLASIYNDLGKQELTTKMLFKAIKSLKSLSC